MKPKIPKMSKWMLKRWIKACEKLLLYYQGKIELKICPFCIVTKKEKCKEKEGCVWIWFMGKTCKRYGWEKYNEYAVYLRKDKPSRWVRNRKRQLPNWIKRLKEELCQKS